MMVTPHYMITTSVRDYECDMQGIVNNAVYQNYMEHCRHEFIKQIGLDFAELTRAGIHVVVARAELDYLAPLSSGDEFTVALRVARQGRIRVIFEQAIHRTSDNKLMVKGRFTCAAMTANGRPCRDTTLLTPLLAIADDATDAS
ncbi:acyl-CoA thioesterase [Pokkaliibacter sp. MBI-7]|uniref:acyl-CoA thioesterase n=1 Tax=Pokkaliibacter sp. MBI-7 TaxID=3040600 RepID=UPI00244727FF|nr:acyl-CoA thioesterase [Pokkaliibacter sp. MBI-7]MDH2434545.1 acyl-CoA thioesterase [Pokkaliibacter sp. MBI-7]